jgi:serine/threonine-protein kinase
MRAAWRTSIHDVGLGNYEPLLELASGGMAKVYVARHVGAAGFERLVVIKRVHSHLLSNRDFCDMFRDEARHCSMVQHPNVVSVVDTVEAEGELFLVLEYVESLSLSALLKGLAARGERLEPAVAARIFADALAGLHAAHEAVDLRGNRIELIHRDVSPQNIIVGRDGTSRLIDFGIAKAASRISVTHSGVVKGKLRYMSPEQVQQKPLDRRADVFSAGVVLYEALTGKRPFAGEDDGDIVLGILLGEVPPPSSVVGGLPLAIDAVVDRALQRDRADRFQTAAELQEALERAVAPASVRDVARVVEWCGAEEFEVRRAILQAAIEDQPTSSRRPAAGAREREAPPSAPPPAAHPVSGFVVRDRTRGPSWAAVVAVLAAVVALVAALVAHMR